MTELKRIKRNLAEIISNAVMDSYMGEGHLAVYYINRILSIEVRPGCTIKDLIEKETKNEM